MPGHHEFSDFLDELAKAEPWCSADPTTELGAWVQGSFDILERVLKSVAEYDDAYARVARPALREIIGRPEPVRARHAAVDRWIMETPTR
jgi:hypothetical protein